MNNNTQEPWYKRNKLRAKHNTRVWRLKNIERSAATTQEWYERSKTQCQEKYLERRDQILPACKARRETQNKTGMRPKYLSDPSYRLSMRIRSRVSSALKRCKASKYFDAYELLGCTIEEARKHIESQWLPNMSWDNHSLRGWHIDHIKPCNTFDLTDPEQQKQCFHYTNLRPLWAKDNLSRPRDGSDLLQPGFV